MYSNIKQQSSTVQNIITLPQPNSYLKSHTPELPDYKYGSWGFVSAIGAKKLCKDFCISHGGTKLLVKSLRLPGKHLQLARLRERNA